MESVVGISWATSVKRQSAYATVTPNVDLTFSHPFMGADMGEHTALMSDNAEHYGKGHEFATRNEILSWNSMFRRQFTATTKILGWALAFHTGTDTVASLGGAPTAYQHDFEYQDPNGSGYYGSGRQQPVVAIMERVTSGLVRRFPSMQVKAVEITGALNDWVMLTAELQGSGMMTRVAPSSFTFPDSTDENFGGEGTGLLRNASLTFQLGVSGSLADTSCDIRNFRWRSEMAYFEAEGYCPGSGYLTSGDPTSGQIRNKLEFARRTVVFEFTSQASASNTLFTQLEANTLLQAQLTVDGQIISGVNRHRLVINIPSLKFRAVPIAADGDVITYAVQAVVMYNQTEANPWTVRVINKTAAYLVSS